MALLNSNVTWDRPFKQVQNHPADFNLKKVGTSSICLFRLCQNKNLQLKRLFSRKACRIIYVRKLFGYSGCETFGRSCSMDHNCSHQIQNLICGDLSSSALNSFH